MKIFAILTVCTMASTAAAAAAIIDQQGSVFAAGGQTPGSSDGPQTHRRFDNIWSDYWCKSMLGLQ
ncbi:hypothetical protein PspLS_02074 [Pyricularia sp. CBS 133598]|nr:hypothetical protein PspLS_02074 [Pyricularia sp. CBS 133598]